MLEHLRQRMAATLSQAHAATLATYGPADIQATILPCEAAQDTLYLLVPRSSDHLFNIESNSSVAVSTQHWQLRGIATVLTEAPIQLNLRQLPEFGWSAVVQVVPYRLHIQPENSTQSRETIDLV